MKNKRLYSKIQKPPGEQSQPQPSVAKRWEEPDTLCDFSNGAAGAVAVPRQCQGHHPTAPARVPQCGNNQHQGPRQRQDRTHCAPAASYLAGCDAAPENTVRASLPAGRAGRPSRLRSLELGLGGGRVPADVEQQEEAEAEGGGGTHGQGLPQHQQRVDGTWARSRA